MDRRGTRRGRRSEVVVPVEIIKAGSATAVGGKRPSRPASPPGRETPPELPVRRSSRSRPRSTVPMGTTTTNASSVVTPSPIKEVPEKSSPAKGGKGSPKTSAKSSNFPTTGTTNTATRAPNKTTTTSSVHSSYSYTTQKTVEIRSSGSAALNEISRLGDYIRRSVSRGAGDREGSHTPSALTDNGSRYSRSLSRSVYGDGDSKAEFSGDENAIEEEEDEQYQSFRASQAQQFGGGIGLSAATATTVCRKLEAPREFGGWFGVTLLLLVLSSVVYYLQWTCSVARNAAGACDFQLPNYKSLVDVKYLRQKVFIPQVVGVYFAYVSGIVVLSALLPGKRVTLHRNRGDAQYKFNALATAVVLTVAAAVGEHYQYRVADYILKNYLRFAIFGCVCSFVVAFWSYFRPEALHQSTSVVQLGNPYGKTGNFLIDYALGREINPKWLNFLEYKQVFYRCALIGTLLFAEAFIYKNVQVPAWSAGLNLREAPLGVLQHFATNIKYDAPALLAATLLLFYILDSIIFEHHLASSFELQHEGFGCLLLLRYATTPYLLSGVAKYFFDRRSANASLSCSYAALVGFGLLFFGLFLKRISNALKYQYRLNPMNPYFLGVNTINTYQGRRLLLGPFWGRVRHPNYTGELLALCALASPLFLRFAWPPLAGFLLLVSLLLHRLLRVNDRNLSTYHSSWGLYRNQVRHYLIPKVF